MTENIHLTALIVYMKILKEEINTYQEILREIASKQCVNYVGIDETLNTIQTRIINKNISIFQKFKEQEYKGDELKPTIGEMNRFINLLTEY